MKNHKQFLKFIRENKSYFISTILPKLVKTDYQDIFDKKNYNINDSIDTEDNFLVKRILVNPRSKLSLQKHQYRAEHWVIVKGYAKVTCGDKIFKLEENQSTYIPLGVVHRLENTGDVPLEVIEIQTGKHLYEGDIVRLEDDYKRQ